jgi:hypothetical protein
MGQSAVKIRLAFDFRRAMSKVAAKSRLVKRPMTGRAIGHGAKAKRARERTARSAKTD